MILLLLACGAKETPPDGDKATSKTCADVAERALTDVSDVQATLHDVRGIVPELEGVSVELVDMESDSDFFFSNLELSTLAWEPLDRKYLVFYNRRLFDDPPPHAAVASILVHELKHVVDYTEMDAVELTEFGLWYAMGDIAEYERETDLFTMERGCAEGLIDYRVWLYANVDDATEAQKRIDYYTPEEIEAWLE